MYIRNGIKMDGEQPIDLVDVIIGDVITVSMVDCTTRRGKYLFDELTGVVYHINPDHSVMIFSWNNEAFATVDRPRVMLSDHNPKSASRVGKFQYGKDEVTADECKFGHMVTLDGDDRDYLLLSRSKDGINWIAYDMMHYDKVFDIPIDTKVTITDRDVNVARIVSRRLL